MVSFLIYNDNFSKCLYIKVVNMPLPSLPPLVTGCAICKHHLLENDDILVTACNHRFH